MKQTKSTALYQTPFSKAYWRDAAMELKDIRILVFAALMIALRVALKSLGIPIAADLKINIAFFINALGAMVFGPVVAILAAAVSDTLGCLLFPTGVYFFPFIFIEIAGSLVFALFLYRTRVTATRVILSRFCVDFFVNIVLNAPIMAWYYQVVLNKSYAFFQLPRILKNLALFPLESVLLILFLMVMIPLAYRMHLVYDAGDQLHLKKRQAILDATAPHTMEPDAPGADEVVVSLYHTIDAGKLAPHRDEVKALFARNAALRGRAARYIASAGSLMLDSRRAEACSANFEKVRRYVKRLCIRLLPRTEEMGSEELRLLSAITPKGEVFYQGTVQALADKCILFRDDYGAVSRLLLELIRAEALARGYHIITCPCAMHPEDKIDHIIIPSLRLAFLTDNRWHPVRLSAAQTVRCSRFVDRENLSACRARLRFNERAAAELLEQACALMAQAKSCHDELETYYRTAVDFAQVDAAAAQCMELFGVG